MGTPPYWTKLVTLPNGCIEWTGKSRNHGYARSNGKLLHISEYERLVGPVPLGLELDHLCRNRACLNVDHLEPVTHLENMRRAQAYRTRVPACPQGHPYEGANLHITPCGRRVCRTCKREKMRARRALLSDKAARR